MMSCGHLQQRLPTCWHNRASGGGKQLAQQMSAASRAGSYKSNLFFPSSRTTQRKTHYKDKSRSSTVTRGYVGARRA